MNILFVYKYYPFDGNYDSGIGRYLSELTNELKKKNKVFILTTAPKSKRIRSGNLTIYSMPFPKAKNRSVLFIKQMINVARNLTTIIKRHKIDIVEFANWESEGLIFTLTLNKIIKMPTVIRLHTPSVIDNNISERQKYFSDKVKEYCEKIFVSQKENNLTTSTYFNAKECIKVYGLKKHIEIIPLGIKPKIIKQKHIPRHTLCHPIITILFVGRLEKRKGIDILIKSIPIVLKKYKNVKFVIVGRENQNEKWVSDLRNSLPFDCLNNVNFLGYIKDPKKLDKIYINSDICIIPSRYESFGLVVLDAMNYGKAIVTSKVGGIPEIIRNKKDGYLINPVVKELAKSINKLVASKKIRKKLESSARKRAGDNFSSKTMAKKTSDFYEKILSK
jgi:glycosyltransferase involved in cell wall biosynthesis